MNCRYNPTHATHSYITECAINELAKEFPELQQFRRALIKGANTELHELSIRDYEKKLGVEFGVDLEAKRTQHKGTNAGSDDVQGWWQDSIDAYRRNEKAKAYFLLGVVLHMVQDMGVPAHANGVRHQGNATEFDNFEFLALTNWKPYFGDINRENPVLAEPWRYYQFSREWTHADAPDYRSRDSISKFWLTASRSERKLLQNRQGRTCHLTKWVLEAASKAFSR